MNVEIGTEAAQIREKEYMNESFARYYYTNVRKNVPASVHEVDLDWEN